jgi:hypothetical protein
MIFVKQPLFPREKASFRQNLNKWTLISNILIKLALSPSIMSPLESRSFIARGYSYVTNVNLVSMLTAGTLASASHLLITQNITTLTHGQIIFDSQFKVQAITWQQSRVFINNAQHDHDAHGGNGIHMFNDCSTSAQNGLRSWLARIYGIADHGRHVEQLLACSTWAIVSIS